MKKMFPLILIFTACTLFAACQNDSIPPGVSQSQNQNPSLQYTAQVETANVSQVYEAVGTIRPLTESVIEAQVASRILTVLFTPGKTVKKDQVVIELDARQLDTRFKQSKEGLSVAKKQLSQTRRSMDEARAGLDQAKAAYNRTIKLFDAGIVSSQKLENDKSNFLQAQARLGKVQQAELAAKSSIRKAIQIVKEAKIARGYTKITSPADGLVAERMADPGDLAVPGKPLLVIQTSGALRLEASVREGLISRVKVGQSYPVFVQTINKKVMSTIQEIVPYADPATRTFLVKAALPVIPGIYPGMFGRLMIPVESDKTLLIPLKAVRRVGQLEMIWVKTKSSWQSVYIKTGKVHADKIEVLAGLTGNENIGYND